jgi:hypothetical protein
LRIDDIADHGHVDAVTLRNRRPVVHARAAEWIDTHAHAGAADHVEVDHVREIGDVGVQIIVFARRRSVARPFERHAFHAAQSVFE